MSDLRAAHALLDDDPDEACAIAGDILREDPANAAALFLIGVANTRAERFGTALAIYERVTRLVPKKSEGWNNLGMCLTETGQHQEAREAFKRAIALDPKPSYMGNVAAAYISEANYTEALRWCKRALVLEPEHSGAHGSMGFAKLATGDWSGWKDYEYILGGRFRKEVKIGDEPRWDGSPVDSLFVYGEQGLGDEIMYASILGDVRAKVTLECDKRLQGLFKRSFPHLEVHGSRRADRDWADGRTFDAGCAIGSLASLYRPTPESCPQKPYLVADPERRLQWRALFDSWGPKPVIGLCWSGGRATTQRKQRRMGLEVFRPLIESTDAHFVSLQYTDATEEIERTGLAVRHIHRAVQSPDYDDTAAFVAECSRIVGVHTTIHHLAGAMGVPSTVLVPHRPMWNYASGDRLPWYAAQVYHRQRANEAWADTVKRLD